MNSVEQSESERRIKILEFVRKNSTIDKDPKITKSDVMRYMKDVSRMMTTHKITVDLIKEGKINMIKEKPHSQIHYLTINENNVFNLIFKTLSEIESSISLLDGLSKKGNKLSTQFSNEFFPFYYDGNIIMLHGLLVTSNKKIHSETDSKLLYKRIIELIIRLDKLVFGLEPLEYKLEHALNSLKDFFNVFNIKKTPENTILVDNYITTIENFKNTLSELNE